MLPFDPTLPPPWRRILYGAPEGHDALLLAEAARRLSPRPLLHLAESRRRLDVLAAALRFFAPDVEVLDLPAWDCRPYDRIGPSVPVMARRIAALRALAAPAAGPRLVLSTAGAVLRRLPPAAALAGLVLEPGTEEAAVKEGLLGLGYLQSPDPREPGDFRLEAGALTAVLPDGTPLSLDLAAGGTLPPVSEVPLDAAAAARFTTAYGRLFGRPDARDPVREAVEAGRRPPAMEHWLPLFFERTDTLFGLLPDAVLSLDERAAQARAIRHAEIAQGFRAREARRTVDARAGLPAYHPVPPDLAFLTEEEWEEALSARAVVELDDDPPPPGEADACDAGGRRGSGLSVAESPGAVAERLSAWRGEKRRILAVVERPAQAAGLARLVERGGLGPAAAAADWREAAALPADAVAVAALELEEGFTAPGLAVVGRGEMVRERQAPRTTDTTADALAGAGEPALALGALVVHRDHGIGLADGMETVEAAGAVRDCLRLVYKGGDTLLVPVDHLDAVRPYGLPREGVTLDRLGGGAWEGRVARARAAVDEVARQLVERAAARAARRQEPVVPARRPWRAFLAGFPYRETEDQRTAIEAVLADLASGRTMDRLVVGDVGVGKTEVALRAAFAVAMAGRQVAVVAPTTPLARQHAETFAARLAGFPLETGYLGRGVPAEEERRVRAGLADGTIRVAVGTHALLAKGVRFRDLGLVVIDEEHRFGVKEKERLASLSARVHVLAMSATPIPRTLRLALGGLRDISVVATLPSDRRPVRTEVKPLTAELLRAALLRERERGGQSFLVCPRIDDIPALRTLLEEACPELGVVEAHGRLKPEALEDRLSRFVEGGCDVLLATNIVETGLDIPNANTILLHHADRFGLAQLHQLRGRVGRSRIQAYAYLTYDPAKPPADTARERLESLAALTGAGAGFAVASRDMDLRGGGELLGEAQSGHLRDIGPALFQDLLRRAVAAAKGKPEPPDWSPQVNLDRPALVPETYVADPGRRLELYLRLETAEAPRAELEAALTRRHGAPPPEVDALLDRAELKRLCLAAGIAQLDLGPKGALLTSHADAHSAHPAVPGADWRDDGKLRVTWDDPAGRLDAVRGVLAALRAIAPVTEPAPA
ncbi:MAG TPA: DEAD/DEAH box helicase [Azospirillaceae bacterium]|nr:DEAD/DEAH box helicase [Azospirillaceae bacterium]